MSRLHWNEKSFQEATYIRHRTGTQDPVHYTFRVEGSSGKAVLLICRNTASSQYEKEIFSCLCDDAEQALLVAGILRDSTLVQED